jgi:hypothetical protein
MYSHAPMPIPRAVMEMQHIAHMQQQAEFQREAEEREAFLLLLAPDGGLTSLVRGPALTETVDVNGA